jgi:cytochrome c peroxidase
VWNIYRNADFSSRRQQRRLDRLVCASRDGCRGLTPAARLDAAIALFKTPGLRDLGHSGPYLHTGTADTLEAVVNFYIDASMQARGRGLRNGASELERMRIDPLDVEPLVAFLRALDEDYE